MVELLVSGGGLALWMELFESRTGGPRGLNVVREYRSVGALVGLDFVRE